MKSFKTTRRSFSSRAGWFMVEYLREFAGVAGLMFLLTVSAIAWLEPAHNESAASKEHLPPVYALGFNGDSRTLWVSQLQSGVSDFNWSSGELISQWPVKSRTLCDIARGGSDFMTTVVSDAQGQILIVNNENGRTTHEVSPSTQSIQDVAVSADGTAVYAVRKSGELLEWRWNGSTFEFTLTQLPCESETVRVSPDGTRLLMTLDAVSILVWDVQRRCEILRIAESHNQRVSQIAWSPDGTSFVSGGDDGILRAWHATTGDKLWESVADSLAPLALGITPDGAYVAAGGFDRRVRVFSSKTGQKLTELAEHRGAIRTIAFHANGETFATGDLKGHVNIWSTKNWQLVRELQ